MAPQTPQRGLQACQECAKAKHRCHGGLPCQRCVRKGLNCEYQSKARRPKVTPPRPSSIGGTELESRASVPTDFELPNAQPDVDLPSWGKSTPLANPNSRDGDCLNLPNYNFTSDGIAPQNELSLSGNQFITAPSSNLFDHCSSWLSDDLYSLDPIYWGFDESDNTYSHVGTTTFSGKSFSPSVSQITRLCNALPSPRPSENGQAASTARPERDKHYTDQQSALDAHGSMAFPLPCPGDFETIKREDSGHVQSISPGAHSKLCSFIRDHIDPEKTHIPSIEFFHSFVQLYFECFDPSFPFIHPSVLGDNELPWILLLAVSAIGCQYSNIKHSTEISTILHEILNKAISYQVCSFVNLGTLAYRGADARSSADS